MQPETVAGKTPDPGTSASSAALSADAWTAQPSETVPVTIIRRSRGLFDLNLPSLWAYRELLFFLTWRDVKVQYKQAAVGLLWVLVQPVVTMIVFTIVFNRLAKVQGPNGVPYMLFAYSGLLPWQLFAGGLAQVTMSVVSNSGLISKVYFPRLIIPIAAVVSGLVNFVVAMSILVVLMAHYRYVPGLQILTLPFFILVAIASALAGGLWLSLLNVRYRDVQFTIPFLIQIWLFLTPVAYPTSLLPVRYRALIGINPMTSVVQGFRWALIGGPAPWDTSFSVSLVMVAVILFTGIIFFRRTEKTFADLI